MFRIFAALRQMVAAEAAYEALGAVAQDAIQKIIIPSLRRDMASARPEDAVKYEALIQDFERASDGRSPESRQWADLARNIFLGFSVREHRPSGTVEEMAQDLAGEYYANSSYMRTFDRFDPVAGIVGLRRFWSTALANQAASRMREIRRQEHRHQEMPDHDTTDMSIPAQPADGMMVEQALDSLNKYIERTARDPLVVEIFNRWISAMTDKGSVTVEHDISTPLINDYRNSGASISRSSIFSAYKTMVKLVIQFFEREMEMRVPDSIKRQLHASVEAVITYEVFRQRMAAWVLGR